MGLVAPERTLFIHDTVSHTGMMLLGKQNLSWALGESLCPLHMHRLPYGEEQVCVQAFKANVCKEWTNGKERILPNLMRCFITPVDSAAPQPALRPGGPSRPNSSLCPPDGKDRPA